MDYFAARLRVVLVAVSALALVSCSAMSPGPKDAPTPEPTGTPIATSTPLSVVDALQASLLPEGEVGAEWSRIPADPRVTRIEGDDTSVRSACAPFRGPAAVTYVAGAHLAGPKAPSDIAKPQWYETIAVFASVRAVQNYMEMSKLDCTAQGESVEQLFDPLGDSSVYVQYGVPEPTQSHRVLLVRRGNSLMQIRYDAFALSDADEHRFELLAHAADARFGALADALPELGIGLTPTTIPSRLN